MNEYSIQVTYSQLSAWSREVFSIMQDLTKVVMLSEEMVTLAESGYEGKAKGDITSYYHSFYVQMSRLLEIHTQCWNHLLFIAREAKFSDEQIGSIIAACLLGMEEREND